MKGSKPGFTLIELLVVITVIGILAAIALPNYIKAKDKAKEAEVKAACHSIQIALERYATDHNGNYPAYILGGDERGWDPVIGNRSVVTPFHPQYPPPKDPLVAGGYLQSYPKCAFIKPGDGVTSVMRWTGGVTDGPVIINGKQYHLGLGDPRFGFNAEIMGNCLDDPRYLFGGPSGNYRTGLMWTIYLNLSTLISNISGQDPANPFYAMGGLPQWKPGSNAGQVGDPSITIQAWWPGQFFYRSGGTFLFPQGFLLNAAGYTPPDNLWAYRYQRLDKYYLGGYGSMRTMGEDVIRLICMPTGRACNNSAAVNWEAGYCRPHPDFPATGTYTGADGEQGKVYVSTPEVFGGGDRKNNPFFPYLQPGSRDWIYGAPDGYKDGIIITLTAGSDAAGGGQD